MLMVSVGCGAPLFCGQNCLALPRLGWYFPINLKIEALFAQCD